MIRRLDKREGTGFEVQWYDKNGKASEVQQMDTVEELAQYLARNCWGADRFDHTPTIWRDGERWCFSEYTPVGQERRSSAWGGDSITGEWDRIPTNREYLIRSLADPNWEDDGGAAYDSMLYYHVDCPYREGDPRAHCCGKPDDFINWDNCNACKEEWLDREVDI